MAPTKCADAIGEFLLPAIHHSDIRSDPWQRNYFQPPPMGKLVQKSFPLIDVRPLLLHPDYTPIGLLRTHGFCVVNHQSKALQELCTNEGFGAPAAVEAYHQEASELVREATGAKSVFILGTRFCESEGRSGELKRAAPPPGETRDKKRQRTDGSMPPPCRQAGHQSNKSAFGCARIVRGKPLRFPHLEFTPLGARQTIRSLHTGIYEAAVECGVIAAEDKICENYGLRASTKEADSIIVRQYNSQKGLGPRYAAYSIWRPLKRVERDPITISPRNHDPNIVGDGLAYWEYENKIPGPRELGGSFLKQYGILGLQRTQQPAAGHPKWFFVSNQEPGEVIITKLFDSASLGEYAGHAPAPWQASPYIDSSEGKEAARSLEIRVMAFW